MREINGVDIDAQPSWCSRAHPGKVFKVDRVLVVGHVLTNDDGDDLPADPITSVELDLFTTEWEPDGPKPDGPDVHDNVRAAFTGP